MTEKTNQVIQKVASKRLFISLLAVVIMTWLYMRLDQSYIMLAKDDDPNSWFRIIGEKTTLYDKYLWAVVAVVIAYVTGDVVGKFKSGSA